MRKFILASMLSVAGLTACAGNDPPTPPAPTPSFVVADQYVAVMNGAAATTTTMNVTRSNGHSEAIQFTATNAPTGLTTIFKKNPIGSSEALVSLEVSALNVPVGEYKLTIAGTSPSASASGTLTVKVTNPAVVTVPNPALVTATLSYDLVVVKWDLVSGATSYKIDRKCGTGTYQEIGTATSYATTYTDLTPPAGTTCTYRVRTIKGTDSSTGTESTAITLPFAETSYVSAAANSTSISVIWSSVTGATGYKLDRKVAGGTFNEITSTTSTSYNDTAVSVGTDYVYRVRVTTATGTSTGKESPSVRFTGSGGTTGPNCCKVCTNSKPCGDSCIAYSKTCRTPGGCACPGRAVVFIKIKDCPVVTVNELGEEINLGTVENWLKLPTTLK